jgi:hypothetical protein
MGKGAKQIRMLAARARAERAMLLDDFKPGYIINEVWPEVTKRPDFADVSHIVISHASSKYPGHSKEAAIRYQAMLEGAALAAKALLP